MKISSPRDLNTSGAVHERKVYALQLENQSRAAVENEIRLNNHPIIMLHSINVTILTTAD
jgi:hypothetical protein